MPATKVNVRVQADRVLHRLSPLMIGANLEDLNYQCCGGLYSQLLHGEHFQEPSGGMGDDISMRWAKVRTGTAAGSFGLEREHPLAGKQSQIITFEGGRGEIGIDNAGLHRWGLHLQSGRDYEGSVCLKSLKAASVVVSLRSANGKKIYASKTLRVKGSRKWQTLGFRLTPSRSDRDGRFALTLTKPGSVVVGYAMLQPGEWGRFAGLNVRKDLAEAVISQGIRVIRYNGSMVTCPNFPDYQWKKMIGPRELRPPFVGTFNPFASHGWGIPDFLAFCQAAGIAGVPGVNRSEKPGDLADLVEYCNGAATSPWGRRRVQDGFKKPLGLAFIQYGNEERINDEYLADFKAAAAAVWAKDPSITMVVSDWMYWDGIPDPKKVTRATCENLDAHVKLLQWARDQGGKVWWDVHVWEAGPWVAGVKGIADLHAWFEKFVPYYPVPIAALEQNAGNHDLKRGLAHACMSNELAKLGNFVPAAAAPNTMQPWQQYTTRGWDQGQIFFTQSKVWYQPSGYVDIMLTQNACPDLLELSSTLEPKEFSITARRSADGRTVSILAVNESDQPRPATIELEGFGALRKKTAGVVELAGKPEHDNTPEDPQRVSPQKRTWRYTVRKGAVNYLFPPHSFSILRFE